MEFLEALNSGKVLIADGAMGTMLQARGLDSDKCPEVWNLEKPEIVVDIHRQYVKAGASIISCNSFGCSRARLSLYHLEDYQEQIITAAIFNGLKAARYKAFVAYSMGPTGQMQQDFEWYYRQFQEQVKIVNKYPVDLILIETMSSLQEARAALLAVKENCILPVVCTMTFQENGRTLTGTPPEVAACVLQSLGADAVGINCNTPGEVLEWINTFTRYTGVPVAVQPNCGSPVYSVDTTVHDMDPGTFLSQCENLHKAGATIIGGCCGTTPLHVEKLAQKLKGLPVTVQNKESHQVIITSDTHLISIGEDCPFITIGERINPSGKPALAGTLKKGCLDMVIEEAVAQADEGADMIDVNLSAPGVAEEKMLPASVSAISQRVKIPLVLDSRNPVALERALRIYPGRALVNSVDLTDSALDSIIPVANKYGAAVVALTMDEQGIPPSAEKRLSLAKRLTSILKEKGLDRDRVVLDCILLSAVTGKDGPKTTLRSLELIKQELKYTTILGISNVSYGLPHREKLNAAFLAMALSRGLDCGILNTAQQQVLDTIRASQFLLGKSPHFIEHKHVPARYTSLFPVIERSIVEGRPDLARLWLEDNVDLDYNRVIAEGVIPALNRLGELYNEGKIFLPQLITSSRVARDICEFISSKTADNGNTPEKKLILATVEGDYHDIGKNIVKLFLESHGYRVLDLGRNVSASEITEAIKKYGVKLVFLSALMTTTLPAMERTVEVITRQFPGCTVAVGGAAVDPDFARKIGAHYYGKDGMDAVKIANRVFSAK